MKRPGPFGTLAAVLTGLALALVTLALAANAGAAHTWGGHPEYSICGIFRCDEHGRIGTDRPPSEPLPP